MRQDDKTRNTGYGTKFATKNASIKQRGGQIQSDYFSSRAKALKNNEYLIQKNIQFFLSMLLNKFYF